MRSLIITSLLLSRILCADELSFHESKSSHASDKRAFVLQLSSIKSFTTATDSLRKVPEKYRAGMAIYQIGDYYATRYIDIYDTAAIPSLINDFKEAGFNAPIIFKYNPNRTSITQKNISKPLPLLTIQQPLTPKLLPPVATHLTPFDQTKLLINAQDAYQKNDYFQATIYYEMMVASGFKERQILINLCYLYGREGSSSLMERLISDKRGTIDYLYAYGIGAIETQRSDLYTTLSPHLIYDKSGRLSLLCAYFFEQERNPEAHTFYKMAYESNPSDPYILYAYARSVDIKGDKEQAVYLYSQLTQSNIGEELKNSARLRIKTLRRTE